MEKPYANIKVEREREGGGRFGNEGRGSIETVPLRDNSKGVVKIEKRGN